MEVGTAALKIFCVMIPSSVDTSLDFGLFRVVRPYSEFGKFKMAAGANHFMTKSILKTKLYLLTLYKKMQIL